MYDVTKLSVEFIDLTIFYGLLAHCCTANRLTLLFLHLNLIQLGILRILQIITEPFYSSCDCFSCHSTF